jgi:hypothetical protein
MAEDGQADPQAAKVAMDGYKWVAARRNPKKYSERMQVSGPDEKPIETSEAITASDAVVPAVAEALKRTGGRDGFSEQVFVGSIRNGRLGPTGQGSRCSNGCKYTLPAN